jgi:hypothetical protein
VLEHTRAISHHFVSRDSVVGIATRYGLDGPGVESRWGRDFSQQSTPNLGTTQPGMQRVSSLFPGVKQPGSGVDHPPPSSARVKGRVELYLYSPSGPSWPIVGRTLPLFHIILMCLISIVFLCVFLNCLLMALQKSRNI